jgi:Zn-dependent protease
MKLLLALLAKGGIGKLLMTGGTMLISMAVYALSFGWPYAVGFVLLILVHELGHFIAARQSGLNVGAPVFIPFVGAWISLKEVRLAPATEAHVAIAGPMLGSVAAFVCYLLGVSGHGRIYMALAQAGFMLNLFNLIPVAPLDGGRLAGVISPRLWLIGAPMLIGLFLWRPSPLLLLLAIFAAPQVIRAIRGEVPGHDTLAVGDKVRYGAQYVGLAAALAIMAFEAHEWLATTV